VSHQEYPDGHEVASDETADGDKHPSAVENRNVYSFPNTGGDAVSGGAHCPRPIADAVGETGRSSYTNMSAHSVIYKNI
jgi:hypothetical protein